MTVLPLYWRAARIAPLIEVSRWGRTAATATIIAVQIFLYYCLWTALYSVTTTSAGLDVRQAVTYSILAVLHSRIRWNDRGLSKDTVLRHIRDGTILYWFLRPVEPRRYYLVRSLGELGYGGLWAGAGFTICLLVGAIDPPASTGAALASAASLVVGLAVLHQLILMIDLLCFWTITNTSALRIYYFVQSLLSGAFVPLWFFPEWFVAIARWLPFDATLNAPVSLYVGRLPVADAPRVLLVQLGWCVALMLLTRVLWRRAARRVSVQGG